MTFKPGDVVRLTDDGRRLAYAMADHGALQAEYGVVMSSNDWGAYEVRWFAHDGDVLPDVVGYFSAELELSPLALLENAHDIQGR